MTVSTRGFFRNALATVVDARQRQANQYVNGALLMLDDATLKQHGYTREELRRSGTQGSIF